jgi:hypothetical protein
MKTKLLMACLVLSLTSCGDKENTGNGADDKPDKGPYQYRNDSAASETQTEQDNTSTKRGDSLGQH